MRRRLVAAVALALAPVLAGCSLETDDELEPRSTPTVTVTGKPVRELPEQLDLSSDLDFTDEVVWAEGTTVHVGEREIDVAPLRPTQVVVLPQGLLALADQQVWFVAGRRADGLSLPPTTAMGLSADGSQVLLQLVDRDDPVAYTVAGALVGQDAVDGLRTARRTVAGPGEYAVVRRDGRAGVVDATGGVVPVQDLPADLVVRGWTGPEAFYGTGRPAGDDAVDEIDVVSCTLGAEARCRGLGAVEGRPRDLVLGSHPAG